MIDIEDVPTRPVPPMRAEADSRLLRALATSVTAAPHRARRRRRLIFGSVTALTLTGATAAAGYAVLAPQHATDRDSARCYARVTADSGEGFPGTTIGMATPEGGARPDVPPRALEVCADLWHRGFLTPRGFHAPDQRGPDGEPPADKPAPHLVACVLRSGQTAVFPGDARVCSQLQLPLLGDG